MELLKTVLVNVFQVQITTLCVSISLSAFVALLCLFTPKMYIIVFQPQKNVRKLTMNSNTYKSSTAGNASPNHSKSYKYRKCLTQSQLVLSLTNTGNASPNHSLSYKCRKNLKQSQQVLQTQNMPQPITVCLTNAENTSTSCSLPKCNAENT